jgi:predicted AlkP superfamily pyrophosphatase or phosphodiesterase
MSKSLSKLIAWGLLLGGAVQPAMADPASPKLIVTLVVDQFSAELFERYRASFTGGLQRLSNGVTFVNGYQSHAATETCPGHSTILTGRHPATTGIIANTWFDARTGASVYCVSVPAAADPAARGPINLRVDTFGDWLKAAQPRARSVSISGKDRAAIMLGGHHADAVYWWIDGQGFGTSDQAGPAGPAVTAPARKYNAALLKHWRRAPPALWPAESPAACAALVVSHQFGGLRISGEAPPEQSRGVEAAPDFPTQADFSSQLRGSPLFDQLALEFAGKRIDALRLGRGPATDLLAVSLSATDYIGHRYGNGGAEMCVQMAALDRALGRFFTKLDGLKVPYTVVLTADHGGIDAAERAAEHNVDARRIDDLDLVKRLSAQLKAELGLDYSPIGWEEPRQLYIKVRGNDPALRSRVQNEAIAWLRAQAGVEQVFTAAEIVKAIPAPGTAPDRLTMLERFHESHDPERSGDIMIVFARNASLGNPHKLGEAVAGHGSPWDYDRRVPILFWWPGVTPQDRPEPIETVDIAPTFAALTHVAPPLVDGRCLHGIIEECRE